MPLEILCIDDKYSPEHLNIFHIRGIKYPKEGELVTLLQVMVYRNGQKGYIVMPYQGQYLRGEIFGVEGEVEVSFNSKRFVNLDMTEITEEQLKEIKEEKKELVKIPLKNEKNN